MHTLRRPLALALAGLLVLSACDRGETEPDAPDDLTLEDETPDPPEEEPVESVEEPEEDLDADGPEEPDASAAAEPPDVEPFSDPDELAEALAAAEVALASGDLAPEQVRGWAAVHQQAYRDLAQRPEWRETARQAVPPELHDAYDLTLHAVEELLTLTTPREELPDWRIEQPPPVDELRGHYEAAEAEFGVPWHVLAAIHLVETRFGRIHGDSHAGAQGPMQFMPATWEAYGEGDVNDPHDAIMAAGRYLAASGAPEDLQAAVFAYNRSDYYVKAVLAHAEAMEIHDHYLDVYHGWRVYYRTVDGDVVLEEGYGS
jgi:hypothetical protein